MTNEICISCKTNLQLPKRRYCRRCYAQYIKRWRAKNRESMKSYYNIRWAAIRKLVLIKYGNRCECCGETTDAFLTIDHKNNDGYQDRKTTTQSMLYKRLARNPIDNNYRLLCWNCNCGRSKTRDKICPHIIDTDTTITSEYALIKNSIMDALWNKKNDNNNHNHNY